MIRVELTPNTTDTSNVETQATPSPLELARKIACFVEPADKGALKHSLEKVGSSLTEERIDVISHLDKLAGEVIECSEIYFRDVLFRKVSNRGEKLLFATTLLLKREDMPSSNEKTWSILQNADFYGCVEKGVYHFDLSAESKGKHSVITINNPFLFDISSDVLERLKKENLQGSFLGILGSNIQVIPIPKV